MAGSPSDINRRAIELSALVQRLDAPSNSRSLTGPRLPDSTIRFAHEDVIFKIVVGAWSYIVWAPPLGKDDAINRILAIVDSPWHSPLESMTIAKIFKAIYDYLLDRKGTRALADRFLENAVEWILDDIRTVWKLPIPQDAPAKRPEKANRMDENTVGEPTITQLRLHSLLFADMRAVRLIKGTTFAGILKQIISNSNNKPHLHILIFDIMCRASTAGMPKIPPKLWKVAKEKASLGLAQRISVNRFLKDARAPGKGCGIEKREIEEGPRTLIGKRCQAIEGEINKLDDAV